eukprot:scaffold97426_cov30-Tisochrysis_lutea.AAC.3
MAFKTKRTPKNGLRGEGLTSAPPPPRQEGSDAAASSPSPPHQEGSDAAPFPPSVVTLDLYPHQGS